jgi:hypothetical protein
MSLLLIACPILCAACVVGFRWLAKNYRDGER